MRQSDLLLAGLGVVLIGAFVWSRAGSDFLAVAGDPLPDAVARELGLPLADVRALALVLRRERRGSELRARAEALQPGRWPTPRLAIAAAVGHEAEVARALAESADPAAAERRLEAGRAGDAWRVHEELRSRFAGVPPRG